MALMDVLRHYIDTNTTADSSLAQDHYDEVARDAPRDVGTPS